jgi:hypothetical protein
MTVAAADLISLLSMALGVFVLGPMVWILAGIPKLWGPERGMPWCAHPFEQAHSAQEWWMCPRCGTEFRVVDGRWQVQRSARAA